MSQLPRMVAPMMIPLVTLTMTPVPITMMPAQTHVVPTTQMISLLLISAVPAVVASRQLRLRRHLLESLNPG